MMLLMSLLLPGDSPALHLIQQVRDEAHLCYYWASCSTLAKLGAPPAGGGWRWPCSAVSCSSIFGGFYELAQRRVIPLSCWRGIE
jgi:hypothetical protein